jgi:hypothetical protein
MIQDDKQFPDVGTNVHFQPSKYAIYGITERGLRPYFRNSSEIKQVSRRSIVVEQSINQSTAAFPVNV